MSHSVPVRLGGLLTLTLVLTGCGDTRKLRAPETGPPVADIPAYTVGCPDVLRIRLRDRPDFDLVAAVDVDGRLHLGDSVGAPAVGGKSLADAKTAVALAAGTSPDMVELGLEDARSARVYLCGPVNNRQRPIPYQGPERILDFLRRLGALQPGCTDYRDVSVVRPNVAAGGKTQVIPIDVEAVLLDIDPTSNIVILPGDQVYVGETRRSSFTRLLPKWARPLYRRLVGLLPPDPAFWWPWRK